MAIATAPSGAPIRIRAFGGFQIDVDGTELRFGRSPPRKPLALLESLVAIPSHTLSAHAACEALWPEADGFDAYRALITTVYRLRRLLRHRDAVQFCGKAVSLNDSLMWVDVWKFERDVRDTQPSPRLAAALELYRGPFMRDIEHPHAFEARDRLQRRYERVVRIVAQWLQSSGDAASAVALYERAIELGATSEDLYREHMQCLIRAGQMSAAADVFQRCRSVLSRRFGVSPSAATVLAFRSICQPMGDQRVTAGS
jgi:two-component SAPR family response regulator